jgi:hypothetical protein
MALSVLALGVLYSTGGAELELILRQGVRLAIGFGVLLILARVCWPGD